MVRLSTSMHAEHLTSHTFKAILLLVYLAFKHF